MAKNRIDERNGDGCFAAFLDLIAFCNMLYHIMCVCMYMFTPAGDDVKDGEIIDPC